MPPTSEWTHPALWELGWRVKGQLLGLLPLPALLLGPRPGLGTFLHPLFFCSPTGMRSTTLMKKAKSECAGQGGAREAWDSHAAGKEPLPSHGLT